MKKLLLSLFVVLLILLTGCQQEITTYKEVIKDGKVEQQIIIKILQLPTFVKSVECV